MGTAYDDGGRDALRLGAAANFAAWHDVSMRALGLGTTTTDRWWLCTTPAPNIFHTAISLRPPADEVDREATLAELRAHLEDPAGGYLSVCDCWDVLPLRRLGLHLQSSGTWVALDSAPRHTAGAGAGAGDPPHEPLHITEVRDAEALVLFEVTAVRGFGVRMPITPFDIHAPAILDDPAMHIFVGRTDRSDRPVAVSMAYVTDAVVGIYGVTTVRSARGNGHGTAMTRAALAVAEAGGRPAVLQPSPTADSLYRRLGFTDLGSHSHWV
jgi:hypothetical protein